MAVADGYPTSYGFTNNYRSPHRTDRPAAGAAPLNRLVGLKPRTQLTWNPPRRPQTIDEIK